MILSEDVVQDVVRNISQITFEVTEKCNLNCTYCAYLDMYNDYVKRESKDLPVKMAKNVINFVAKHWNSSKNRSHGSKVYIGFYGGEPLIRFGFIQEIVDYIRSLKIEKFIQFSMTTNALLINKYVDYLVENKFNVLISLDGNKANNSYRLLHNGNNSFEKVYKNIVDIKNKYPIFFENHVNFNSVLHNKNDVTEIYDFFIQNFGKTPLISEIRDSGLNPEEKDLFKKMYTSVNQSLDESAKKDDIIKESFIKLPSIKTLGIFLHKYGGYNYNDYSDIKEKETIIIKQPTGTCLPFSKKMFVTANGLLLPCETIDHKYYLGNVTTKRVNLDFEKTANYYISIFEKLRKRCENCYINKACEMCVYKMGKNSNGDFVCTEYMGYKKFQEYLSKQISKIEDSPYLYNEIMQKVTIE